MIVLKIFCLLFALWTAIALIWDIVESSKASDFTYFLCRPLRLFGTTMLSGTIIWIICIILAVYAFNFGITLFS